MVCECVVGISLIAVYVCSSFVEVSAIVMFVCWSAHCSHYKTALPRDSVAFVLRRTRVVSLYSLALLVLSSIYIQFVSHTRVA